MQYERPTENPPWLCGALMVPFGIGFWGINALLIPFLLRRHGVAVDRIAGVLAVAGLPSVWCFLWCPVIDLGLRRRTWILLSSGVSSLCMGLAILESSGSLQLLTILLLTSQIAASLGASTIGAVLTTVRPTLQGRASGWVQAANVGAGSLGGGAAIWLADNVGLSALAAAAVAALFLPTLAALRIVETPHPRMAARPLFSALFRDVRRLLWSWPTMVGLIFFLSPVGAGALGNLISSVGPDYHASTSEVAWVTGLGGGLLLAMGGVLGGFVCDRMHRMTAYAVFGILSGIFALWLAFGPPTPFTYGAGYAGYAIFNGFAYAAFLALVLEVLGAAGRAAATGYTLLFCSGNLPVVYMTWLDGVGYKHAGARGLMGVDALSNVAGGLLLVLVARYCARNWKASGLRVQGAVRGD
jgi:MFS transporter, PAT family, beta-lactamase induction signal transducer AmpG